MKRLAAMLLLLAMGGVLAGEVEVLHLELAPHMERADLYFVRTVSDPKAVLVLCPGLTENPRNLALSPAWQEFAHRNKVGLVVPAFRSSEAALKDGTGYYYASQGSGEKLLEGIRKIYGKDLPLLLYGFSAGAQFTSRFEEWKPERVLAWCAYSAGWWDDPQKNALYPPGIVACGEQDPRNGACVYYFKQGRAVGKPWLWINLPSTDHERSAVLDEFVKKYFSAILAQTSNGVWVNVDSEDDVSAKEAQGQPSLSGWLPSRELFESWRKIHEP